MLPGIVSKEMSLHSQLAVRQAGHAFIQVGITGPNGYLAVILGSKVL